jgi:hypothetical protein
MRRTSEFVTLPGALRGNGKEAECEVRVEKIRFWNLQGWECPPEYGRHEITQVDADLPNGHYQRTVHDMIYELLLDDGQWTQVIERPRYQTAN